MLPSVTRNRITCDFTRPPFICCYIKQMDTVNSYCKWFTTKVLQVGPIPKHVAFIMDGNRRFARKTHIQVQKGHQLGFETLKHVKRNLAMI
jgi:undecaprenyl pyrophosphate synthase